MESKPHAVAYWSRRLKDVETHYRVIEQEALAVVKAEWFDPYVYICPFTIATDLRPLTFVFTRKKKIK